MITVENLCVVCGQKALKHCGKCNLAQYCTRECQEKDWTLHKFTCSDAVEIVNLPTDDRGARIVSRKNFREGDEILREKPFVRIHSSDTLHVRQNDAKAMGEKLWEDRVPSMTETQKTLLYSFTDAWNTPPTAGGICRTNCIPLGDPNDCVGMGLFGKICRANHSCSPNARYIWRHDLDRELLLAVKTILPGEEITVTYGPLFESKMERQLTLLTGFQFLCNCEACAEDDPIKDKKRTEISFLDEEIIRLSRTNPKGALRCCEKIVKLAMEMDMGAGFHLKRFFHDAHQICAMLGRKKQAEEYYNKAHRCALLCEGGNSPHGVSLPKYC